MKAIIQSSELVKMINDKSLKLIDAGSGPEAKSNYQAMHLQGALYFDLDTDLSAIKENAKNGGRHPLPTPIVFSKILSSNGINPSDHIVIYDDKQGANAAARLWWMLRAIGHKKVQVLNGGLQEAKKNGFPISDQPVNPEKTSYNLTSWMLPMADMEDVEKLRQSGNSIVIDVRAAARYRGEIEPIDLIAGHIPGAINVPLTENLDSHGNFKKSDELREMYNNICKGITAENIIIHCGSGVTACHTILAMDYAGLGIPKLYVGSWSEWSRNNKPIGKIISD